MAFELPTLPFPRDPNNVPYIASPDANGKYTVASGQWFKNASGLWVPVSSTDPLPTTLTGNYVSNQGVLVNTLQLSWREDFAGSSLSPDKWTLVQQGSGHTISVGGSALSIATGTTANTETIIRSVQTFTVPFRVMFIFYLSQRIANQEFYLEVTNAAGTMLAQWLYDGTSAVTGKHNSANAGTAGTAASASIATTGSYAIAEIELFPDEAYFHSRAADSSVVRTSSAVRSRLIPDPNDLYYVQIRARNLSSAPASSTTLFVDAVTVQDIAELTAEITAGRGQMVGSQAIASHITGLASGLTLSTINYSNSIPFGMIFTDSTTALGAGATFTGTSRSLNYSNGFLNTFRARVYADQAGTLFIDQSRDNATWRSTDSIAVAAGETKFLEAKVVTLYARVRYVNGATAQGAFELVSLITST